MIFQVRNANFKDKNIYKHASKKYEKISSNRELSALLNKIFRRKFGDIVAKIWIFKGVALKFNENQEMWSFDGIIAKFDDISN